MDERLARRLTIAANRARPVVCETVRAQLEALEELIGRGGRKRPGAAPTAGGVTALFSGPAGTGKTLAAARLARAAGRELYRVHLLEIVSKYIGETEKNLEALFAAAEQAGAILLFDEADALFGKRGAVKDAHDRYANLEVSYLLRRLEAFDGVAIFTSNRKANIDRAFLRRLRFVIDFPRKA